MLHSVLLHWREKSFYKTKLQLKMNLCRVSSSRDTWGLCLSESVPLHDDIRALCPSPPGRGSASKEQCAADLVADHQLRTSPTTTMPSGNVRIMGSLPPLTEGGSPGEQQEGERAPADGVSVRVLPRRRCSCGVSAGAACERGDPAAGRSAAGCGGQ